LVTGYLLSEDPLVLRPTITRSLPLSVNCSQLMNDSYVLNKKKEHILWQLAIFLTKTL